MANNKAHKILEAASDKTLAGLILTTFTEVEKHFFLRSWKTSELDSGHFVEASRRFIDFRLTGSYTPVGTTLPTFNSNELRRLENASGSEAYRLHIPRALFAIYGLRNKRGVGHLGLINPNYLDATFIMATCKWVLGEFLRAESTMSFDETVAVVEQIIERPLPGIWDIGNVKRVLADGLSLREQILFLLLAESPQSSEKLRESTGYKNENYFDTLLRKLHDERHIERMADGVCHLSPKGRQLAEKIALGVKR
ncbi:MAG TPA: hypothetical protein VKV04_24615 [Verrucomicrobiae bacterium]|nr:hypothetical protein [Verrucomicrobiae bacterium]